MQIENQLIVLKFGTTSVCDPKTLEIKEEWIQSVAEDVKKLQEKGNRIVIFSSGALATGRKISNHLTVAIQEDKNILGSLGLSRLMHKWQENFSQVGLNAAPLIIREEDVDSTAISITIIKMVNNGLVPIINENIPLQNHFNNDELASKICKKIGASKFVLFTDTDGVFTDNPKTNPAAKHIKELNINEIDIVLEDENTGLGSGGMKAKLEAAIKVRKQEIDTIIANGVGGYPISNIENNDRYTRLIIGG